MDSSGGGAAFHFTIPDSQDPDLREKIQGSPAMAWDEVHRFLDRRSLNRSQIGEVAKALDLAQAIVRDLDGTIVFWTKGAERLFGLDENQALGKQLHDLLRSELSISRAAVEAALMRDGEWNGEMKLHKGDKGIIWLAVHKVVYREGNGRVKSVVEVYNDITSLKVRANS